MPIPRLFTAVLASLPLAAACSGQGASTQPETLGPDGVPDYQQRGASLALDFPEPSPVGEFVVKTYPAYRAAIAQGGNAFWPLFNHIKRNDIQMTTPVAMPMSDPPPAPGSEAEQTPEPSGEAPERVAMIFLYEHPEQGTVGVDPADDRVEVIDYPPLTVASYAYRGQATQQQMAEFLALIDANIATRPDLTPAGPPRLLGYNGPSVPRNQRFFELQRPVQVLATPATQPDS
ncbi:MAG: heme-binding protein [Planctomycetota bacterium]